MDRLNVAVIGTGLMGSHFARILSQLPQARLRAVCDPDEARSKRLAVEVGAKCYLDYEEMLRSEPEVQAVVITVPDTLHLAPALCAIGLGKHVFIEKPLATTVAEARQICEAADSRGLTLMVGHYLRFDPRYVALHNSITSGDVGQLISIYMRRNPSSNSMRRIGGRVSAAYWVGVHDIDIMNWITRVRPAKVFAREVRKGLTGINASECIAAMITLEDGTIAILENSWASPAVQGRPMSFMLEVRGEEGVIDLNAYEQGILVHTQSTLTSPDTLYFPSVHGILSGPYRDEMVHFVDCVFTRSRPVVDGRDGLAAVVVADAIERSIQTGSEIDLISEGAWD